MRVDIPKELREIRRHVEKRDYQIALDMCDDILSSDPFNDEALREKSSALVGLGDLKKATQILADLSDRTNEPADYFDLAGVHIRSSNYPGAISALDALMEVSEREEYDYYVSSALFLRAFALIEIGDVGRARSDVVRIPDGMRFWVPGRGLVDVESLRSRSDKRPSFKPS